jgi:hypothetical protein
MTSRAAFPDDRATGAFSDDDEYGLIEFSGVV